MASFLKLNSGDYLLQTDGIGKILLAYSVSGLITIAEFFSTWTKPRFTSSMNRPVFMSIHRKPIFFSSLKIPGFKSLLRKDKFHR